MPVLTSISAQVKQLASECGFDAAGIAGVRAEDFPELAFFEQWIERGHAGEMEYLKKRDEQGHLKRAALEHAAPWAKSVVVCAVNYNTPHPYSTEFSNSESGWISRYAWSAADYHDTVLARLRNLEGRIAEAVHDGSSHGAVAVGAPAMRASEMAASRVGAPSCNPLNSDAVGAPGFSPVNGATRTQGALAPAQRTNNAPDFRSWCYVDTGPLVERVYAKYAGVGWIGKNTCIINQQLGSWLFLGVILTSLSLEPDLPAADRCGTCTRCIDACPTDALIAPYQLAARRCIAYLTIEKRGTIPEDLREGMGRHVFGCDICQDVCPWNSQSRRESPRVPAEQLHTRAELVNPSLEWLATMDDEEFRRVFRGSPVKRAKRAGLRRNVAVAMGNSGDARFVPVLEQLADDTDEVVAEHARWALERLRRD